MVLAKKNPLIGIIAILALFGVSGLTGCAEEDKLGVTNAVDASKMPQLSTRNVLTLISDSGYTKYKVVTPLWNVYNTRDSSLWDFPEGVYLRQLDRNLNVVATVAADSACYFPNKKLWELYGDVEIDQKDKAYFFSQWIFFDDRQKRIYSDTFIHIETPTQILEGVGFESNEDLTKYRVLKPSGMFPAGMRERDTERHNVFAEGGEPNPSFMPDPLGGGEEIPMPRSMMIDHDTVY